MVVVVAYYGNKMNQAQIENDIAQKDVDLAKQRSTAAEQAMFDQGRLDGKSDQEIQQDIDRIKAGN